MKCTKCNQINPKDNKFCPNCGKNIKIVRDIGQNPPNNLNKGLLLSLILIPLIILIVILGISFTGKVVKKIMPPNPKIIDVKCINHGTGFLGLDQRTVVEVTVQNLGGSGNIRVVGSLDQSGTDFDRTDSRMIYLNENEMQVVDFDFDSSSFRDGKCVGYVYPA